MAEHLSGLGVPRSTFAPPIYRLPIPDAFIAVAAVLAGVLFGLVMAALIRREARRLGLPRWPDYTP